MNLIGIDFSMNKPAACVLFNNNYYFFAWPKNLHPKNIEIFKNSGINVIERYDNEHNIKDLSFKMRYEVDNAKYLSNLILETLKDYMHKNTLIAFEGFSYGSKGDAAMQLVGYKYMLMHKLSEIIPLNRMYTYAPITIKSISGCAKKGMKKFDMINAFIQNGPDCKLHFTLCENKEKFLKKGGKTYIDGLDDCIDSFFILKTLQIKIDI